MCNRFLHYDVRLLYCLNLQGNRQLVLDLISVHLIRHIDGSTILSFHPDIDHPVTDAKYMHKRIRFAGESKIHSIYVA